MGDKFGLLLGLIGVAAVVMAVAPVQAFDDQDPGWQALSPAELEAQRAKGPNEVLVGRPHQCNSGRKHYTQGYTLETRDRHIRV